MERVLGELDKLGMSREVMEQAVSCARILLKTGCEPYGLTCRYVAVACEIVARFISAEGSIITLLNEVPSRYELSKRGPISSYVSQVLDAMDSHKLLEGAIEKVIAESWPGPEQEAIVARARSLMYGFSVKSMERSSLGNHAWMLAADPRAIAALGRLATTRSSVARASEEAGVSNEVLQATVRKRCPRRGAEQDGNEVA